MRRKSIIIFVIAFLPICALADAVEAENPWCEEVPPSDDVGFNVLLEGLSQQSIVLPTFNATETSNSVTEVEVEWTPRAPCWGGLSMLLRYDLQ